MTREEKQKAIDALKISAPIMAVTQEEFNDYIQTINQVIDWLEQQSCEDCISRQEVLKQLKGCLLGGESEYQYVKLHIDDMSSVTPQPKIGQWINIDATHSKCDRCGAVFEIASENGEANYCPNCGAKMQEVKENDN